MDISKSIDISKFIDNIVDRIQNNLSQTILKYNKKQTNFWFVCGGILGLSVGLSIGFITGYISGYIINKSKENKP
jgi:hypothetical protein